MQTEMHTIVQNYDGELKGFVNTRPLLVLIVNGAKTISTQHETISIHAPDMLLVPSNTAFSVINKSDKYSYKAHCVVFDTATLNGFYQRYPASNVDFLQKPLVLAGQTELSNAIIRLNDNLPYNIMQTRYDEILAWLAYEKIYLLPAPDNVVSKIRKLIENVPYEKWLMDDVAARLAMSKSTLRRVLNAEGCTYAELVDNCRTSHAVALLQSTDYSIERIAQECGYSSAYRFSLKFKKRFGVTPAKFKY
jgi:AraC-like DNA-binding protein